MLDHALKTMALPTIKCLLRCDCPRDVKYIMEHPQVVYLCEQVPAFRQWLMNELYTPRSLMRLCRSTLRACLSPDNLTKVHTLDIPRQLQDFILCRNLRGVDVLQWNSDGRNLYCCHYQTCVTENTDYIPLKVGTVHFIEALSALL